jgi:protein O-GlcNAc transferase
MATASIIAGCATHGASNQRLFQEPSASTGQVAKDGETPALPPQKESLESFIERTRKLQSVVHPQEQNRSLEREDSELASARLSLAENPTAANHRRVGAAYLRLGVLDAAYDQFKTALRLDSKDAASYDGLARVWRDWGLPHLGLGDAHRAIYYAPTSAPAYNTLGTILQRLGQTANARAAFQAALRNEPGASYALNNLCYTSFLQGRQDEAIAACRDALRVQPALAAAQNNLGLAYWAQGDHSSATEAFASLSDPAVARYNTGIALLGSRQYWQAAQAFDDAGTLSNRLPRVKQRAQQARTLAAGADGH